MALTPRLDLRQSQSLVMTPQLQQAIKMLQLSSIELLDYVEQELEQNPLLERQEEDQGDDQEGGDALDMADELSDQAGDSLQEDGGLESIDFSDTGKDAEAIGNDLDVEVDNEWNTDEASPVEIAQANLAEPAFADNGPGGATDFSAALPNPEETLIDQVSLRERLNSQMTMTLGDPEERMIGTQLIDMLDDSGYISDPLEGVAETLGCALEQVEQVLEKLQRIDQPGLFARDLAECLALQLRERDRLDPAMQTLLENLDLLAKRDLKRLTEICGVDAEDIADMFAEIKELDPKPGLVFEDTIMQPVVPDVIMRSQPGGGWIVELNSDTLPRVLVNNTYFATISSVAGSKEDKRYINECYQSANWLVKSLHQRATTILKVASEIVSQQDGFFTNGVQHLRPLVLRDIAEVIDMHESTVSRVTSNKFIASPRGIFELKYFFTAAIASSSGGETHSAESVRYRIKELIDEEAPAKILSDDKIVTILKNEGMDIARRTVAKYREALGLSSSVQRRREKNSAL
ncbi:MAG: RNA polymerase factor sigma-54 [Rhodospirillaceae bacterium]|jgi:RNA polymerase sigma-54 factor|nr:RNA polymerase factor sigma-54 [Rhodospirillaceae bacterium]MBT5561263.1 RNA polymerase factor sigma-54 [Rhodospirillaceae bacterium]MBT6243338.1 RNA polymerase factor sigma-54 [Rhodospirillaceae bacterium]MBT7136939.1 RNA polymerase factor sigma-54 [Rhodospirillaceae bacterium]